MAQLQAHTSRSAPRRLFALAGLSLAGIGVSIYLTQHYYELRSGAAGFKSFCNMSETMNCDAVTASAYADVLPGLPLSSFATGWFLTMFVLALVARNVFWRRETLRLAFAMSALGILVSGIYLAIMAGVLHTYCLFCLVTDGLTLSIFALILSLKPEGFAQHKLDKDKWKTLLGVAAAALLVSVLGLKGMESAAEMSSSEMTESARSTLATPVVAVATGAEFPSIGPANAPITIVEFSDFQCPHCRFGALIINSVIQRYPGQVRVVFRNFPLDSGCNRKMDRPMHPHACEAAKTAICAGKQGKFEPVYQTLFENQITLAPGRVAQLAQEAGADPAALKACIEAPETQLAISRDVEEASNLNINSTPTIFINGHRMQGASPPAVWHKIIDELLKGEPLKKSG